MTAAGNCGRFRLVQKGGGGPENFAWAVGGSGSFGEECCADGRSSKRGGVENCSGWRG